MAKEKSNLLSYCGRALGLATGITLATILITFFRWEENTVLGIVIKFVFVFIVYFPVNLLVDKTGEKMNREGKKAQ